MEAALYTLKKRLLADNVDNETIEKRLMEERERCVREGRREFGSRGDSARDEDPSQRQHPDREADLQISLDY